MGGSEVDSVALGSSALEVQAGFPDDATLQAAVEQLRRLGYGRSDLSLPEDQSASGLGAPSDNVDNQQLRTMGSSMAGTAAAFALAGATIATGGALGVAALGAAAIGARATAAASTVAALNCSVSCSFSMLNKHSRARAVQSCRRLAPGR